LDVTSQDIIFVNDKLKSIGILDVKRQCLGLAGYESPYLLLPACSEQRQRRAQEIRAAFTNIDTNNDPAYYEKEAIRDSHSYVFTIQKDIHIVGTIRIHPITHGTSYIEEIGKLSESMSSDSKLCEMSRLVLDPNHRGNVTQILADIGRWMVAYTSFRTYVAICIRPFLPLYKRLGATPIIERFMLVRSTAQEFAVIYGEFAEGAKRSLKPALAYGA
jgi:hypothetical protein